MDQSIARITKQNMDQTNLTPELRQQLTQLTQELTNLNSSIGKTVDAISWYLVPDSEAVPLEFRVCDILNPTQCTVMVSDSNRKGWWMEVRDVEFAKLKIGSSIPALTKPGNQLVKWPDFVHCAFPVRTLSPEMHKKGWGV